MNNYKKKLIKMGYDSNKTEFEIMSDMGYLRIYDCGNKNTGDTQRAVF